MRYPITLIFLLECFCSSAQLFPVEIYPHDYFRDPLEIPMSLAANFGELRPNHYHMGLDIRTQHRENLPVLAAADGYVAKVVIEPLGFGQAIYLRHPNGYTTLYAHLNSFFPALAAYVEAQQYRQESWQVSLDLPAGMFRVRKGDLIAYSGNRGGSQGPHLHFEIRRTSDDTNLNPLLFGLPVPDDTDPEVLRLAVYDRNASVYEQLPRIYPVHRGAAPGVFSVSPDLLTVATSRISFAISAFDTQSGSTNPNGIYEAVLYEDDLPLIGFRMNNISYNDTRNINAHIDYKTREAGGPFLQHLSRLPGYTSPSIYHVAGTSPGEGVIDLSDGAVHLIHIEVKDAYGNTSHLRYRVLYKPSVMTAHEAAPLSGKEFYPGMLDTYETNDCAFYIGEKSLYDSVHIPFKVSGELPNSAEGLTDTTRDLSLLFSIGETYIPLQEPLLVRIKAPADLKGTDRVVMVRSHEKEKDVQRPEWQGGWASAHWHEFGDFRLVQDGEAPRIIPLGIKEGAFLGKATQIAFRVRDDLGAIGSFRAELDGKWLCFTNDKRLDYIYKFDAHCPPGRHTLKVSAEDVAGNRTVGEYHFTR